MPVSDDTPVETAEPAAAVSEAAERRARAGESAADTEIADTASGSGEPSAAERRRRPGRPRWLLPVVLGVATLALLGLTVHLATGYQQARARAAAEREVLLPAKSAAARILSYDYRHIRQDAAQGAGVLTGDFRNQYDTVMRQQIIPQAPRQHAIVQAEVLSAGVSQVNPDGTEAVVLVFANQTVSNSAARQPRVDQVRVRLVLDRVAGQWLVSKVDAV